MLAMLLVTKYFPARSHTGLRVLLGTTLVMFWMPPLFLLLLARHTVYLWFPVLMLFLFGIFKLAGTAPERIPGKQVADATLHLADIG